MSQPNTEPVFISDEETTDFKPENEPAANQSEQSGSETLDNLPIESIGSYARVDEPLEDKDSSRSENSPSET